MQYHALLTKNSTLTHTKPCNTFNVSLVIQITKSCTIYTKIVCELFMIDKSFKQKEATIVLEAESIIVQTLYLIND